MQVQRLRKKLLSLLAILCLGAFAAAAQQAEATGGWQVVHGWPQLPEDFAFGQVSGIAVDSHDHVFVLHRGKRPIMYFEGETGRLLGSWGHGMFKTAHGLRVDAEDNIWATDVDLHVVYKFSHDGELLMVLGKKGVAGLDPFHFNRPTDVAFSPQGDVYVADGYGNSRIVKFNRRGEYLLEWGQRGSGPGEFNTPHGIAVDSEGLVYVADRGNARIQVFTPEGKYLYEWKSKALGRPWAVTVGPDGRIYVADGGDLNREPPERNRILILDRKGRILETFGRFGNYDGQFYWAHCVAVSRTGAVYVGDVFLGMRAQKFVKR